MKDTTPRGANVPPSAEKAHAIDLGISFNGTQYVYRDFKYDKLSDAIAYAELDSGRPGTMPDASLPAAWLDRQVPGDADQEAMRQYGIVLEEWRYRYWDYRYDRLVDAVNFARKKH
jgi:hypothetical protein